MYHARSVQIKGHRTVTVINPDLRLAANSRLSQSEMSTLGSNERLRFQVGLLGLYWIALENAGEVSLSSQRHVPTSDDLLQVAGDSQP